MIINNTRIKKIIIAVILAAILQYYSSGAEAEGNIHIGALEIHPLISLDQVYDDNIFREPKGQENSDWLSIVTIGGGIAMPLTPERKKDFTVKADYRSRIFYYNDYQDENRTDHKGYGEIYLNFADEIMIRLNEDYHKTADPATSENTEFRRRYRNDYSVHIDRQKNFLGFGFGYRSIRDNYKELNNLDKYENIINANLYIRTFSKTILSIEGRFGTVKYDENTTNSDSGYREAGMAIKGKLAPKTSGVVKGGYRQTKYDDERKSDFSGYTAFANVTYQLKERFVLNLYGERQPYESTYLTNSYFVSNKAGIKADLRFVYRFYLSAEGYYALNTYPDKTATAASTEKRKDKLYGWDASLRYESKDTLIIKFSYEKDSRNSNFDFLDFRDNKYSGNVTLMF